MAEIITFLIWLCMAAIVIYIIVWALISIVQPPARVQQLIYVMAVLILLLIVVMWMPFPSLSNFGPPRR